MDKDALANLANPAIAWVNGDHYIAVLRVTANTATINDPNQPGKEDIPLPKLLERSGGVLLLVSRRPVVPQTSGRTTH